MSALLIDDKNIISCAGIRRVGIFFKVVLSCLFLYLPGERILGKNAAARRRP
jgi:hypothetical protein